MLRLTIPNASAANINAARGRKVSPRLPKEREEAREGYGYQKDSQKIAGIPSQLYIKVYQVCTLHCIFMLISSSEYLI
jgi:hypothetical protein